MRVLVCQMDIAWEDKSANHKKVMALLETVGCPKDALVVLPEMFSTGFSLDVPKIAEGAACPSERFLSNLSAKKKACVLGGVVHANHEGKGRNEAVAFGP